jgi:cytochrome c-type biogenesis protein CcmF
MLAEIGLASTFFAFVAALYAIGVAIYGARSQSERLVLSARNAALLTFPLLLVAAGALVAALVSGQYQLSYVWSVSDPNTPLFFRITALWGSQKGSILFWSLLMSAFAGAALLLNWHSQRRLMPYVIAYTMATLAFFLGLSLFFENPFERFWILPNNEVAQTAFVPVSAVPPSAHRLAETAQGLNPLLRHFGMIIHPPMLYLGFVGFVIPFAFAMAALASGDLSTNWIKATRRWVLVAWLFLSLGLLLGGRWAYDVLGWGGYWGWDPVENAAFLPWLIGTAFLHSVMIQEKRGMLKVWNMFLVIGAFSAVIFGTFATRSGLIDSVHSFARSQIGFPMFFFWAAVTLISVGLILWRWNRGELRDEHQFASIFSRESLFVLNNVVFIILFVAIFWGSFGAPVISELFLDTNITLGTDYFMRVTPPLFVALYVLMGIAPLSAWGATSLPRLGRALAIPLVLTLILVVILYITGLTNIGALFGYGIVLLAGFVAAYEIYRGAAARVRSLGESWPRAITALFGRNQRRYGGYVIHIGVTVIGIGVIGSTLFQQETQQTLSVGESLDVGGYTLTYDNLLGGQISEDGRIMDIAEVTVSRGGQPLAELRPRRDFYPEAQGMNSMTIAGAYSTLENDFYVLLVDWEEIGAHAATFKVYINPLINLVWWGGLILMLGTFITAWPRERTAVSYQPSAASTGTRVLGARP